MGGANDAHVDWVFGHATDLAHTLFLYRPQQFHLHGQRQIGNLIEKQRATARCLKKALALAVSAGKCPLAIAEKLAFHQVFRNRTAIHRHKGIRPPRTALMHQPRRQLLAATRLAGDINRCLTAGELVDHRPYLLHCHRITDQTR